VIDTAPEQLRRHFVGKPTTAIVAETALFRRRHRPDTPLEAARLALRTLARRWEYSNGELVELDAQFDDLTAQVAPTLRATNSVGAQVATALFVGAPRR
jgi:transposase